MTVDCHHESQELAKVLAQNLPKAAGSFGLLTNKGGIDALMSMVKGTPLEEGITTLLGIEPDKQEQDKQDKKTNKTNNKRKLYII